MDSEKAKWVMALIHFANYVEGKTRLQKLAFLSKQLIGEFNKISFYDDWDAGKFGPFSPSLSHDLNEMIASRYVSESPRANDYGFEVTCYVLTDEGRAMADDAIESNPKIAKAMKELVSRYSKASLMELLHDVYVQFPKYTIRSEIKSKIDHAIGYRDNRLSSEFDEPEE
jgi:uncharacterized protein YwgA